jgi:hypothetical protein
MISSKSKNNLCKKVLSIFPPPWGLSGLFIIPYSIIIIPLIISASSVTLSNFGVLGPKAG